MKTSSLEALPMSRPVQSLVSEIVALHGEILSSARTCLTNAIRIGELLTQEKAGVRHGEWLRWIKGNVPFGERSAQNYMRLYHQRELLKCATVADLAEAYRVLGQIIEPGPRVAPGSLRPASIDVDATVVAGEPTGRPCPSPRLPDRIVGFAFGAPESIGTKGVQYFADRVDEIVTEALEPGASVPQLKALSLACQAGARRATERAKRQEAGS